MNTHTRVRRVVLAAMPCGDAIFAHGQFTCMLQDSLLVVLTDLS